ncbi:HAMP domain-containing histidine kinase [Schnuerera sp. xch1]|uniref:HAMP domain-containing sensor histidine kinase n=1 Tax=Schnuerera sp. xch1 TaxID=2874283 RepID=UPI001CBB4AEB|nr:HAMP domain-containing sensor histidine kinase [Schnuerera sp. xch1]MBZ2175549.1 HAMP domain-containing histidine kinase [Schnuerera sp. xch1]
MSISKKLTISFIFAIIVSILIIGFISNTMINNRFDNYLIEEQNEKFERVKENINNLYIEMGNNITDRDISSYASIERIYIEIRDLNDNIVASSNNQNYLHRGMHQNMMKPGRMMHQGSNYIGEYVETSFPIVDDDKEIGTLVIGYIDNSFMTEGALIFKSTLTKSIFISSIITIIIGLIISIFISKGLTNPIIEITNTANQMRDGNLEYGSDVKTNTKEISQLSYSINYLAETLKKQEDLRNRYATDIAHELRTPLTTLKSHVEAMIDGIWKASNENLLILDEEIDRLTKLIEDLKNTFKSLEVQLNINKTNFNISDELKNIISTFNPLFEKEGYILKSEIEENIHISMDKNRLKQIMYNLLSNALKFLKDEGKVTVSLSKDKDYVKIIVEDNGIGIKEKDLPHIFERFYKSDMSRNRNIAGTGLGLSITKALIDAHGGEISVESQIAKGTKFIILLPH